MLQVRVRYFAAAADASGRLDEEIEFSSEATLSDLKSDLSRRYGASMDKVIRSGSFLVGGVVRRDGNFPLSQTVDVLPPFAGG
ncbi:MAG: MoaD/ThiS family protein [Cryobacterium sp.]|nr:MoaD/ThiS family protein [Cryobacterium sp.]